MANFSREYKSKLCSLEFIRRHGYLRESTYLQCGGPLCWERSTSVESWSMSHAPLHCSDEGRQGAGHELCYHCTLSGLSLSCMHTQSHSITGVLSHRIHQSSSQWWAINGKLVSYYVRSFLEVVWHCLITFRKLYLSLHWLGMCRVPSGPSQTAESPSCTHTCSM